MDNAPVIQWTIQLKEHHAPVGLAWVKQFIAGYDLSLLESICIERGRSKRAVGVYGKCFFPTPARPKYRIHCVVPGPFPCQIHIRKPPLYMDEEGRFPPTPPGCRRGVRCIDRRTGRQWYRIVGYTALQDADEAVVWIFAHEAFHFLRRTKQIPGRNNEIQADAYGDAMLETFRRQRENFQTQSRAAKSSGIKTLGTQTTPARPVRKPRATAKPARATGKGTKAASSTKANATATPTTKGKAEPVRASAVAMIEQAVRSWLGLWSTPPRGRKMRGE